MVFPVGKSSPHTPFYIFGDGAGFLFCKTGQQCDEKFTCAVHGEDILPLKENLHTVFFQLADRIEGVYRIPGKPGEGFCNNKVSLSVQGIGDHAAESFPAADGSAAQTFIRIDIYQYPIRVVADHSLKVILLGGDAVQLLIGCRGYPGIGCDSAFGDCGWFFAYASLGSINAFYDSLCHG